MKFSCVDRPWALLGLCVLLVSLITGLPGCTDVSTEDEPWSDPADGSMTERPVEEIEVTEESAEELVEETPETEPAAPDVVVPEVEEAEAPEAGVEEGVEEAVEEGTEAVEEEVTEDVVEEEPVVEEGSLPFGYTRLDPVFDLPGFKTEHYEIYSQMSPETTYDVAMRCESLYKYYAERFADEYYPIDFPKKMFLFGNREDFVAAGGHPTMPGLFMGGHDDTGVGARFMMITSDGNWGALAQVSCPLLYHEAFHQFVALEISQAGNVNRHWPTFLDEGHATMFNNLMWTGDGFVDGVMTLPYLTSAVDNREAFIPFDELLYVDGEGWHRMLAEGRVWTVYMQGMSVHHFLYYAEDGKYKDLIETYVYQVSTDANGEATKETAQKIIDLEAEFLAWFDENMIYPEDMWDVDAEGNPVVTPNVRVTGAKFYEAMTAMAMSHLARTSARGQTFESGQAFMEAAQNDGLDIAELGDDQWLPDTLREEMIWWYDLLGKSHGEIGLELSYSDEDGSPVLIVTQPKFGLILQATCTLDADGNVEDVDVLYVECPSINFVEAERIVSGEAIR